MAKGTAFSDAAIKNQRLKQPDEFQATRTLISFA